MTVTWTSGYNIDKAVPFVEWGSKGNHPTRSPAGTLTFDRGSMCGMYDFLVMLSVPKKESTKFFLSCRWSCTVSWLARSRIHTHQFLKGVVAQHQVMHYYVHKDIVRFGLNPHAVADSKFWIWGTKIQVHNFIFFDIQIINIKICSK